jgi:RimJ/RimL family protein N-acetyltransferase
MPPLVPPAMAAGALASLAQPTIEVDGLVLRPWTGGDASAVVGAYSEPTIQRWHVRSMTPAEATAWIEAWVARWNADSGGGWAIASGSAVLGQISLRRVELADGLGELSYWVVPAARGDHVASRALRGLTAWLFGHLALNRLEVSHSTVNPPSCRVAANAGYRLEGTKRREALHADGWHDMHLHARLRDDEV